MKHRTTLTYLAATLLAATTPALALEGTETLGAPSIAYPQTGEIVLAGVGLVDGQPDSFSVALPAGRTIQQVVAYWDGLDQPGLTQGATDTILLGGLPVVGERIGGGSNFFQDYWVSAYRADVTGLGLLGPGDNLIAVEDLDFTYASNGLALVIVLDDEERSLEVRDGLDYAYTGFPAPFTTTEAVLYGLEPSDEARDATIDLLIGGVALDRPSVIEVRIDGALVLEAIDLLGNLLGPELDAVSLDLEVPAGATEVSVQLLSEDRGGPLAGLQEASLTWLFSSLTIDIETDGELEGCDPYFWLCNWWRWDPWCTDDNVTGFDFKDRFNETFDVSPWRSGLWDHKTLGSGLMGSGWCNYWLRVLNREAVAALLNADSVNYPYTVDEVRALYRDAVGEVEGPETLWSVLCTFHEANRLGCPF